jgi:hypothetical protein
LCEQLAGGEGGDGHGHRFVRHVGRSPEGDAGVGGHLRDQLAERDLGLGVGDALLQSRQAFEGRTLMLLRPGSGARQRDEKRGDNKTVISCAVHQAKLSHSVSAHDHHGASLSDLVAARRLQVQR